VASSVNVPEFPDFSRRGEQTAPKNTFTEKKKTNNVHLFLSSILLANI